MSDNELTDECVYVNYNEEQLKELKAQGSKFDTILEDSRKAKLVQERIASALERIANVLEWNPDGPGATLAKSKFQGKEDAELTLDAFLEKYNIKPEVKTPVHHF
jgi:hypothetical protein